MLKKRNRNRVRGIAKASEAERWFQALLDAAPDAMVVVDQYGKIVLVNTQTERLFGYQREEILGLDVEVLIPERLREQHRLHRKGFFAQPHGNAVLSRYPIRSARLVPFTVGYDWFKESQIRPLEKGKRKAAVLVGEDLLREVRRGQRTALYVDLDVPGAPGERIIIVSTHLENRAKPKVRRQQMEQLLNQIQEVRHPVIVAGDLNTTGSDSTPTSVENMNR